MPVPILSVRNLTVYFHDPDDLDFKRALERLSLDIYPAENFALIGESGSGKTTFARAVLGQVPPIPGIIEGEIKFTNQEGEWDIVRGPERVWRREESMFGDQVISQRRLGAYRRWSAANRERLEDLRGKRIAFITQDVGGTLNPYIPVGKQITDCINAGRNPAGRDKSYLDFMAAAGLGALGGSEELEDRELQARRGSRAELPTPPKQHRLRRLNDLAGLEELARRYPSQLSGGQRQRVLIAMALASEPDLILADEPTTGLDVLRRNEIIRLFERLVGGSLDAAGAYAVKPRTTFLLITHDLDTVRRLATRIGVLYDGRLMEVMPIAGEDPKEPRIVGLHPYTQVLVGSYENLEYEYRPPREGESRLVIRGCHYRPACQLYAAHLRRSQQSEYDRALIRHCVEREPPLFPTRRGGGEHLVRCWGRVDSARWGEVEEVQPLSAAASEHTPGERR